MFNQQSKTIIAATVLLLACIPAVVAVFGTPSVDVSTPTDDGTKAATKKILADAQNQCTSNMEAAVRKAIEAGKAIGKEIGQNLILDQLDAKCYAKLDETLENVPVIEDVFRFTPGDSYRTLAIAAAVCFAVYLFVNRKWHKDLGVGKHWDSEVMATKTHQEKEQRTQYLAYAAHVAAAGTSSPLTPAASANASSSTAMVPCTPGEWEQVVEENVQKRTSCLFKIELFSFICTAVVALVVGAVYYRVTLKEPQPDSSMWDRFLARATDIVTGYVVGQSETTSALINTMVVKCFMWFMSSSAGLAFVRMAIELGLFPKIFRVCLKKRLRASGLRARGAVVANRDAVAPGGPMDPQLAPRRPVPSAPETFEEEVEHIPDEY